MGETCHAIARTSQICSYVKWILCQQNLTHRQNGKLSVKKAVFSASIVYRKLPVLSTVYKILPEKRRWIGLSMKKEAFFLVKECIDRKGRDVYNCPC
jgi:hypothetical protein